MVLSGVFFCMPEVSFKQYFLKDHCFCRFSKIIQMNQDSRLDNVT